jgi:hypothetical protein
MLQMVRAGQVRTEPQWVALLDGKEQSLCQGEFLIKPSNAADRRRRQKSFKMCPKCAGLGVLPIGDGAPKCQFCHGRPDQPSMDKPEIQVAIAEELCLNWRGVPSDDGGELEFTSENLAENITAFPQLFWAMLAASDQIGEGQRANQGKA